MGSIIAAMFIEDTYYRPYESIIIPKCKQYITQDRINVKNLEKNNLKIARELFQSL